MTCEFEFVSKIEFQEIGVKCESFFAESQLELATTEFFDKPLHL